LLKGEPYRGYNVPKREYFYGVKVQLVTNKDGIPVEMYLAEGKEHDSQILQRMYHGLPAESAIHGDSGYTIYELEDLLKETEQVHLKIARKTNSKRKHKPYVAHIKDTMRKIVETSIHQICSLMPRYVNDVTTNGFIIKLILFVMAFQIKNVI
jgi:hypothetical protein